MKQIGKVLLCILIGITCIGVIYLGVYSILRDMQEADLVFVASPMWEKETEIQRKNIQQSIDNTMIVIEERLSYENRRSEKIETVLAAMTLEQKLAQMMILTNELDITQANMEAYQPGGVIFFGVDFKGKTIEQVKQRVDILQSYMQVPLWVGVDEEGGDVSRVSGLAEAGLPKFESARRLSQKGTEQVIEDTINKMQLLKSMGINLNFDPVADVVDDSNSYMYTRSASGEAQEVAEYVETVLSVMQEERVAGCIKHFPGYGNNVNTHNQLARDSRLLSDYEKRDFIPFQAGIGAGVDMVMVSHIIMESVDGKNPASLSSVIHDMLRKDFEFQGVIIADDLNMQAILATMTIGEATSEAFLAGNDMIFSADFAASMQGAKRAVEQGLLTEERINESVRRVLCMKIDNGLIEVEK